MYRVLIVDDDSSVCLELLRFKNWNEMGFEIVAEAYDGKQAIEYIENEKVDVIISDISMPKINGLELLGQLKSLSQDISVVFISGHSDFNFAKQALVLGAFDYLLKPIEQNSLIEVLERLRTYLDDKREKENEKKIIEEKLKESLKMYYPFDEEKNLIKNIIRGNDDSCVIAKDIFDKVLLIQNGEIYNSGVVIGQVLSNTVRNVKNEYYILEKFLKLEKFENVKLSSVSTSEELKETFYHYIEKMLELIKKYELHQSDSIVSKVCHYVIEHIDEEINLSSVSENLFISKNYLSQIFKQKTGGNFNDYVSKMKMERAKAMLMQSNLKAYEISQYLGYSETEYFSKLFKKYIGMTPTEYRKNREITWDSL